jgi:hemin uptake protein HemP
MNDERFSAPQQASDHPGKPPKRLASEDLFRSGPRVEIVHCGQVYVLQVTRQGKLTLTK